MVVRDGRDGRDGAAAVLPRFYAGRELFITGATGFLGKVVLERLLATCPDVGRLHLLLRTKKGTSPETRLAELKRSPVFDVLRRTCNHQLNKLRLVPGDVVKHNLGLSEQAITDLEHVSVVLNAAATVKMDEELSAAVELNVTSVSRVLDLCDRLPNVAAFVHVSSAYCHAERALVEERVYAPRERELQRLLRDAAEPMAPDQARRFISPKPNTYTFTKMLAEAVVAQHTRAHYARAIFRPTIVISSLRDPFPGWVDNLNGPAGVAAGVVRGALRVMRCVGGARADMLPVDLAADTLIAVAWETATDQLSTVRVYNCSTLEHPTDWEALRRCMVATARTAPSLRAVWYPNFIFIESRLIYKTLEFLLQTMPLHLAEYVSRIFGNRSNSWSVVSARLSSMNQALEYFCTRSFRFPAHNVRRLRARLTPRDHALYNLDPSAIDWKVTLTNFVLGVRRHLLREPDDTVPAARRRLRRLYFLDRGLTLLVLALALRYLMRWRRGWWRLLGRLTVGSRSAETRH